MTHLSYYDDSYLKELTAKVISVNEDWIELDQTIFYPLGGGQPGDTGTFMRPDGTQLKVIDSRKGDQLGSVIHQVETHEHGIQIGDEIETAIDWDRRYRHMRMHTGMHLLGALVPVPVTGGSVGVEKSRLDFDLGDHEIDKDDLTMKINKLIENSHVVKIESISDAELDENPDLVRTMSVQPPRGTGTIRMIRVMDIDYQPCGGTHVKNTAEIGKMRISNIENKGRRNRRVHLVWDN